MDTGKRKALTCSVEGRELGGLVDSQIRLGLYDI
jgi:hypothetical protein